MQKVMPHTNSGPIKDEKKCKVDRHVVREEFNEGEKGREISVTNDDFMKSSTYHIGWRGIRRVRR